jgi:hypothetical protein
MMAEHVFLDDAIFLTLETTSTFLLMLFKLIIKELCLFENFLWLKHHLLLLLFNVEVICDNRSDDWNIR